MFLQHYAAELGSDNEGVKDIQRLMTLLDHYGISDWVSFDPSVVRGLAYYTGIVFEAFDTRGQFRAICGGGRYDNLISSLFVDGTDTDIPGVGFGFGDAVIEELLRSKELLPSFKMPAIDVIVYCMDETLRSTATQIVVRLRAAGVAVDYMVEDGWKPKWVFQRGDKVGAGYVLMLATSEHRRGEAVLKNLKARSQTCIRYDNLEADVVKLVNCKAGQ